MRTIPPNFARSALDFAPDAMVIVNTSGTILFTNRQVSVLFGYPRDEITGKNVEMKAPPCEHSS